MNLTEEERVITATALRELVVRRLLVARDPGEEGTAELRALAEIDTAERVLLKITRAA